AGEALAQRERALRLQDAEKRAEALAAWRAAAAAWQRAGDGPGQVEAEVTRGLLLGRESQKEADVAVAAAVATAMAERRRPLAAATALDEAAIRFYERGDPAHIRALFRGALAIQEELAGPEGTPSL